MTSSSASPSDDLPGEVLDVAVERMDSPVGELTVVATHRGVRSVMWSNVRAADHTVAGVAPLDVAELLDRAVEQLTDYFVGDRRHFDIPLDPVGTAFQLAAWDVLRTIEYGTTISYGEQAACMGDRAKARAVGAANGQNPIPIIVPCHRVVGGDGRLTGFAGGLDRKRWLLDHEVRVVGELKS